MSAAAGLIQDRMLRTPGHFRDRTDAGRQLAYRLADLADRPDVLVLAIPRGGVPVAYEVARALHAPLDVIVVRKLGYPGAEELAMGAVSSGGVRVLNPDVLEGMPVPQRVIDRVASREGAEVIRRERLYRGDRPPFDPRGKTVIVVDDGLATGSTMRAAVTALRQRRPAAIIAAVPVGAADTCRSLAPLVDRFECVIESTAFFAVGIWYDDFSQTGDDEVRRLLDELAPEPAEHILAAPPMSLAPDFFIEESGTTITTVLVPAHDQGQVVMAHPGDRLSLSIEDGELMCKDRLGRRLGMVEPTLAARLIRLMRRGKNYAVGTVSISRGRITVLIREADRGKP